MSQASQTVTDQFRRFAESVMPDRRALRAAVRELERRIPDEVVEAWMNLPPRAIGGCGGAHQ